MHNKKMILQDMIEFDREVEAEGHTLTELF